jgi:RHS repeat-associated protein
MMPYCRRQSCTALGNWSTLSTDADGAGSGSATNESRTHDGQNRITAQGAQTPTYDQNGNLKKQSQAFGAIDFRYDAWNRMVEADVNGGEIFGIAEYPYDALGRRTKETRPSEEAVQIDETTFVVFEGIRNLYYSDRWQVIEERYHYGETLTPADVETWATDDVSTNVWTPGYVDEMVGADRSITLTERDVSTGEITSTGTVMTVRTYAQQDANFNVTSIYASYNGSNFAVTERFTYDPYGQPQAHSANWAPREPDHDPEWHYLHQGGRWNAVTGTYHFRHRELSTNLGRWIQQDPLRYVDGASVYQAFRSIPASSLDPSGLKVELQSHLVAGDKYHTSLKITPDNQAKYRNDARFQKDPTTGLLYTTLGAGPSGLVDPDLESDFNRPKDKATAENPDGSRVTVISGLPDDDLINKLLTADAKYTDDLNYDFFPKNKTDEDPDEDDPGYNSNSYIAGILAFVGALPRQHPDDLFPGNRSHPGWFKPLPPQHFQ